MFEYKYFRYPLKAVKVMHTVALRTEATMLRGKSPENFERGVKVSFMLLDLVVALVF
jgi:pyruvate kinase